MAWAGVEERAVTKREQDVVARRQRQLEASWRRKFTHSIQRLDNEVALWKKQGQSTETILFGITLRLKEIRLEHDPDLIRL